MGFISSGMECGTLHITMQHGMKINNKCRSLWEMSHANVTWSECLPLQWPTPIGCSEIVIS